MHIGTDFAVPQPKITLALTQAEAQAMVDSGKLTQAPDGCWFYGPEPVEIKPVLQGPNRQQRRGRTYKQHDPRDTKRKPQARKLRKRVA